MLQIDFRKYARLVYTHEIAPFSFHQCFSKLQSRLFAWVVILDDEDGIHPNFHEGARRRSAQFLGSHLTLESEAGSDLILKR